MASCISVISILLLSCSMSSGVLGSSGLLLSYSMIKLALHVTTQHTNNNHIYKSHTLNLSGTLSIVQSEANSGRRAAEAEAEAIIVIVLLGPINFPVRPAPEPVFVWPTLAVSGHPTHVYASLRRPIVPSMFRCVLLARDTGTLSSNLETSQTLNSLYCWHLVSFGLVH